MVRRLVEAFGPSGHEAGIRSVIRGEIETHCDDMRVDALGNLIALKRGKGRKERRRIMVAAHMDEIGAMVSYVEEKGFVRIAALGGVNPMFEVGGRLRFENGVVGVIGVEKQKDNARPRLDQLFVDVGATGREDCPVEVGDAACFLQPMEELGKCLAAKAMDDRIGCAVMIQAMKEMKKSSADVYFVFTTQEEVGLRGATVGAFGIEPEVGIAVDVTATGDTPEPFSKMAVSLGKGTAVKIKDRGMLATGWVKEWMINTAEKQGIAYQREVLVAGATDAAAIQRTRAGVATGCISVPCRYVHSPSETVHIDDVKGSVALLRAMLEKPAFKS